MYKNKLMKKIRCLFCFLILNIFVFGQQNIYSYIDSKPVYKYTDSNNWDTFEVTSFGSGSIDNLNNNAKYKLLVELIEQGYTGKKLIKPLSISLSSKEKFLNDQKKINTIINDTNCIISVFNKKIKPIFLSKRKQYSKTFLIKININNVLVRLNQNVTNE